MKKIYSSSFAKNILLSATLVLAVAGTSKAALTYDIRATAGTNGASLGGGGKTVGVQSSGSDITLQIWAQVTNATPVGGAPFGIQAIMGSIVSTSVNAGDATGSLGAVALQAPFTVGSQSGGSAQLSTVSDGILDRGAAANLASPDLNHVLLAKDGGSGGTQVAGSLFFATDLAPNGATVNTIANGFEFLMGTATLSLSSFSLTPGAQVSMNWVIPASFSTNSKRNQRAAWTQGDNLVTQGSSSALMFVAAPVVITAVPEPSAFGMVLIGALGLVGFRRLGFRRA